MQQIPEEIERVMVGIEAYLSIRSHASEAGLSFFEDDDESEKSNTDKVHVSGNYFVSWEVIFFYHRNVVQLLSLLLYSPIFCEVHVDFFFKKNCDGD